MTITPEQRQPLEPMRLTIFCAPEGGWIAEGDTQATRPLAAFSNAANLISWLAERLHQHESRLPPAH